MLLTFLAGASVMALFTLAVLCLVAGLRAYRVDRTWMLAEHRWLDTAHSAL